MSEHKSYVYEHWRPDRGECFHVGKGTGRRANDMRNGRNKHHQAIQEKLSRLGLPIEIRIVASGLTATEAFHLEVERIAFWKADGADLTNIELGGRGGGLGHSRNLGRKMSQEQKDALSAFRKGKCFRKDYSVSEETKAKLSEIGHKNKEMFKEYAHLGPKASSKIVVCVNDGTEFESASAAARYYGVAKSALIELCLGKNNRKTVGGKIFKYKEDV